MRGNLLTGWLKKGEEQREELKKLIRDEVSETLYQMDVAKKQDLVTKDEISQIGTRKNFLFQE